VILTMSTTHTPATDLGYLLHKHPDRAQSVDVVSGTAHVFYPMATEQRCTAAVLLEIDPVALVKGHHREGFVLAQYVNDRPYAASSLLAVALQRLFRTALAGRCDARPDLVAQPLPLELHLPAVPCRGGTDLARRLLEHLGWQVSAVPVPLDPELPDWGDSPYVDLKLVGMQRLSDALNQVYVLLPVLDDAKHYWVGPDEVDKLIRAGGGWLASHPDKELIIQRYLAHQRRLTASAMERLAELDDSAVECLDTAVGAVGAAAPPLAAERRRVVVDLLRAAGASRVGDLGCGDGRLLRDLLADPSFKLVVGADVSARALSYAERRLNVAEMSDRQSERLRLVQSSLTYRDERLAGLDAAVLMEVVEHVDPPRLPALARSVFGAARPGLVLVTTPNAEHNVRFGGLAPGAFRHPDHRFEWTRRQFQSWASAVAADYGYRVRFVPVGEDDAEVGPPTQLAVFECEAA
jgi:3' terminal RNA ribose 2'-O-methyltransferase Hen1